MFTNPCDYVLKNDVVFVCKQYLLLVPNYIKSHHEGSEIGYISKIRAYIKAPTKINKISCFGEG